MKKVFFTLILCLIAPLSYTQSNTLSWLNTISADTSVGYTGVKTDVNGYIYAFGFIRDSVDMDPGPGVFILNSAATQSGEAFFAKYTPSGSLLWVKKLDVTLSLGNEFSSISNIDISSDGYLAIAGAYNGVVDMDPGVGNSSLTSSKQNAFIAKYDTAGTFIWARRLVSGTIAGELVGINYVSFDQNGGIIYSGNLWGTTDFDTGAGVFNLTSAGSTGDVHVSKINSSGNWQWTVKYGSTSTTHIRDMLVNSSGDVYLCGNFRNTLDFNPGAGTVNRTSAGDHDMYLLKLNTNGVYSWVVNLGSAGTDLMQSICFDNTENVVFTGSFEETVDFEFGAGTILHTVAGSPSNSDIIMAKYSPAGVYMNSFSFGGTSIDEISQIEYLNGKYYLGGYFYYSTSLDPVSGTADYTAIYRGDFVVVYDEFGQYNTNIVFDTAAPYPSPNYYRTGIALDPSGAFVLCGQNRGISDFNPQGAPVMVTSASINYWDGFLSKYNYNPCNIILTSVFDTICQGNSIFFNSSTLTTAGIYTDTLIAFNGCDSLITLHLSVNPTYNQTETVNICNGDSYTLPNGTTVTTAGTYTSNLTTINGCDSIIVSTVNVTPTFNQTEMVNICNGDSYTLPNGTIVTNAGTYTSSLTTVNGCDSIIVSTVSVNPVYNQSESISLCSGDSYTLPNGTTVSTAGAYTSNLTTVNGCDSIIVSTVSVHPTYNQTESISICNGDSYTLPNGTTVSTAGAYTSSLTTVHGCDSIIVSTVTVNPTYNQTESISICNGDSYTLPNGTTVSTAGAYTSSLTTVNGCDSIIVSTVTVYPTYNQTESISICNGDSYTLPNGTTVSTAGAYTSNLTTVHGCDSIIVSTVSVHPTYNQSESISICNGDSYTLPNGTTVSTGGTYTSSLTTVNGCDSIIVSIVSVITPVITTTLTGNSIQADAVSVTYQWVDCNQNYSNIPGETNQQYYFTQNGSYAVVIIENGCIDTSDCVLIEDVGISETDENNRIVVYPNPSSGVLNVSVDLPLNNVLIKMYDVSGKLVYTKQMLVDNGKLIINTELPSGAYYLRIETDKKMLLQPVIISK